MSTDHWSKQPIELQPSAEARQEELEEEDALTRLKYVEQKLNHVWSRWHKEYLIGLREFHKNKASKSEKQYDLRPGDIVFIEDKGAQ